MAQSEHKDACGSESEEEESCYEEDSFKSEDCDDEEDLVPQNLLFLCQVCMLLFLGSTLPFAYR